MQYDDESSFEWSDLVPGGVLVYFADGDEEILHANQYLLDLFECEDMSEFMQLTGGTFRGVVYGSEVDSTEDGIWGQVVKQNGLDHIYYQIRTKTGRVLSVDDYGRLVRRHGKRPVFYVFVVEMDKGSVIDWLTGLPGMERFQYMAEIEAEALASRGYEPVVLVFDLMGMKTYNALNGRDKGNRLLCEFATVLRRYFGSELCCRYAGDSFCTLAAGDGIENRVQAVFHEFAMRSGDDNPPVMAGGCKLEPNEDIPLVLDRAKYACDTDRSTWESHLSWFSEEMRRDALLRTYVLEHVDQAMEQGWIHPCYQGIVRSSTSKLCGIEALARWDDPVYGPIEPCQFIPALEGAGLLRKLDMHIVDCVTTDFGKRVHDGLPVVPVSVNLSLRNLSDVNIAREISRRANDNGIPHELLRVEFAESASVLDAEALKAQVLDLHAAGFEVWMDDFGSGYSSLGVLEEFDFDVVKLDISFLTGGHASRRAIILDGVVRAAKRLGVRTIAEGVETEELAERLVAVGCDMLQGYHFFRPGPVDTLQEILSSGDVVRHEPLREGAYWDRIGLVSLTDLAIYLGGDAAAQGDQGDNLSELPAGVVELRQGAWHLLRSTKQLYELLLSRGVIPHNYALHQLPEKSILFDDSFEDAVRRCDSSGSWERIAGPLEYGSGIQFRIKELCACDEATAYVIASAPTPLGSALGTFGDVPVGYAVFHVLYDEDEEAVDAEYAYANVLYRKWGGFAETSLIGKSLLEAMDGEGPYWLALCNRAAAYGERINDVVYSERSRHWLSYSVTPSLTEGYCIVAFTLADAEQEERLELIEAGTHDPLTGLLNRRGIDEEIMRRIHEMPEEPFVLILLDVDDFKTINDLYGHDVGDEALRVLARELSATFPPSAVVGRNGGDETLVGLFGEDAAHVERYMERFKARDLSYTVRGRTYPLSFSAGYAWCSGMDDLKGAYTRADEALYAVKLAGKSGFRGWTEDVQDNKHRSILGFTTRELAEGMPLAMIAHRASGEILFANNGLARLLGFERLSGLYAEVHNDLLAIVHPDDRQRFQQLVETATTDGVVEEEFELPLRVVTRDRTALPAVYRGRHVASHEKGEVLYAYIVSERRT